MNPMKFEIIQSHNFLIICLYFFPIKLDKTMDMLMDETYKRSSFYVGWMRLMLVCNDSFSPKACGMYSTRCINVRNEYNI